MVIDKNGIIKETGDERVVLISILLFSRSAGVPQYTVMYREGFAGVPLKRGKAWKKGGTSF